MTKKILIIGAGMAGLSAGIHACRNGYEVEIFEKHNLPGGLCTVWERKGYIFDGCIHWLVGTGKGSQFNRLWQEVCPINELEIVNHEKFFSLEGSGSKKLDLYCDLNRLEEHLLELFPGDHQLIVDITEAGRQLSRHKFPLEKPEELIKIWDMPLLLLKMMPMFKLMGKFSRITIADYLKNCKDSFLQEALGAVMPPGYSMFSLISTLASFHACDAGFPAGGSLKFARSIENRFLELGGKVCYGSPVAEVIIEGDQARGLKLVDGQKAYGDLVISAADLYHTHYDLLQGSYLTPIIRDSLNDLPLHSSVQVSFGVDSDLSGADHKVALKLDHPIKLGSEANSYIYLTNYSFDPTLAPAGKSVVSATLYSGYEYWEGAVKKRELYRERKEQLAEQVQKVVEKRFPATKGRVEVIDVATPWTYHRYTNVYKGSYMAWIVPPEAGRLKIPKELPGLTNFYQIGQWVEPPAGLPGSMLTGRQLIQIICKKDKKSFQRV